jgi:hypothetical protein
MILFTVLILTCYFYLKKNKQKDFSCQFDQSCISWEPSEKVCEKHGPIKFIREDFCGCKECNDKWRNVLFPKK